MDWWFRPHFKNGMSNLQVSLEFLSFFDYIRPMGNQFETALAKARAEIDAIDDQLLALFKSRMAVVERVGKLKAEHAPGRCPIRPGREAEQIRRVAEVTKCGAFSPEAAVHLWRLIIMASLQKEGVSRIALAVDSQIARDYFSPLTHYSKSTSARHALAEVVDGKADVAVVPYFAVGEDWWVELMQSAATPKLQVFAALPCIVKAEQAPLALAVARLTPEKTASDVALLGAALAEGSAQQRVQEALTTAGFEVQLLDVAQNPAGGKYLAFAVKGFIAADDEKLATISLAQFSILGAYATPLVLP